MRLILDFHTLNDRRGLMFDCIIRNGSIVNGTGEPSFVADIAITDGAISLVVRGLAGAGRKEIDATGLVVAPGFIDIHSHSDVSPSISTPILMLVCSSIRTRKARFARE